VEIIFIYFLLDLPMSNKYVSFLLILLLLLLVVVVVLIVVRKNEEYYRAEGASAEEPTYIDDVLKMIHSNYFTSWSSLLTDNTPLVRFQDDEGRSEVMRSSNLNRLTGIQLTNGKKASAGMARWLLTSKYAEHLSEMEFDMKVTFRIDTKNGQKNLQFGLGERKGNPVSEDIRDMKNTLYFEVLNYPYERPSIDVSLKETLLVYDTEKELPTYPDYQINRTQQNDDLAFTNEWVSVIVKVRRVNVNGKLRRFASVFYGENKVVINVLDVTSWNVPKNPWLFVFASTGSHPKSGYKPSKIYVNYVSFETRVNFVKYEKDELAWNSLEKDLLPNTTWQNNMVCLSQKEPLRYTKKTVMDEYKGKDNICKFARGVLLGKTAISISNFRITPRFSSSLKIDFMIPTNNNNGELYLESTTNGVTTTATFSRKYIPGFHGQYPLSMAMIGKPVSLLFKFHVNLVKSRGTLETTLRAYAHIFTGNMVFLGSWTLFSIPYKDETMLTTDFLFGHRNFSKVHLTNITREY
jgi:hypothetical protein